MKINDFKLLSFGNTKTLKSLKKNYVTAILHLSPFTTSGYNVCQNATNGCMSSCLYNSGCARIFKRVNEKRIAKTKMFFEDRASFWRLLTKDIEKLIRRANKREYIPTVRLNGTSDIKWEEFRFWYNRKFATLIEHFPELQFYDYTKIPGRVVPKNYDLTFSLSENNSQVAKSMLHNGMNVAVVFNGQFPDKFWGINTVSGEENDLRFLDPKPSIICLKAKALAKKDNTGFVYGG